MACYIRSAAPADVPLLLRFIRELAAYEKLLPEVEASETRLHATLFPADHRPVAESALAFWDGEPAGFVLFFHNYSTFLARPGIHLEDLYVRPELRGRGVGKALWLHVARLANARGCGRFEWAVLDWNEPAKGFYRKLGAAEMSDWRLYRLTGAGLQQYA
ncbi:MAG: GNAT family N-acetyltransferase [Opitutaceae bacterium]|nr:GNAT family N-acetyltransferase [Opitutaceae bacterium]